MKYIEGNTFAELYSKVIDQIYNHPDYISAPRGLKIKECLNVILQLNNPYSNLFKCSNDKKLTLPTGYTKKEIILYLNSTTKVSEFAKASNFWNNIVNPDGETINSAYGNLIFNPSLDDGRSQFDWAFDCLKNDKDSRQAFMRYNNTNHQFDKVKDLPCTFIQIFHIRNNKLDSTIMMRSNDIILGLLHDVPSFTLFQHLMYLRLKEIYPDLEMGKYTHLANSLHLYESGFEMTEKRLNNTLEENGIPMPNNWNVIKSTDVEILKEIKLDKQPQLFNNWSMPENNDFYNWILS
jgi:thymidylate synthase